MIVIRNPGNGQFERKIVADGAQASTVAPGAPGPGPALVQPEAPPAVAAPAPGLAAPAPGGPGTALGSPGLGGPGTEAQADPIKPPDFSDLTGKDNAPGQAGAESPGGSAGPGLAEPGPAVDYDALARFTFGSGTGLLTKVLGPEWAPASEQETEGVVQPLAAYFKSKGVRDIPPGVLVLLALGLYCAPRVTVPNTRTKLRLFFLWTQGKLSAFFGWFKRRFRPPRIAEAPAES